MTKTSKGNMWTLHYVVKGDELIRDSGSRHVFMFEAEWQMYGSVGYAIANRGYHISEDYPAHAIADGVMRYIVLSRDHEGGTSKMVKVVLDSTVITEDQFMKVMRGEED